MLLQLSNSVSSSEQIFNTSLFELPPPGYENVSEVLPPYNAFSAQGTPTVRSGKTQIQPSEVSVGRRVKSSQARQEDNNGIDIEYLHVVPLSMGKV